MVARRDLLIPDRLRDAGGRALIVEIGVMTKKGEKAEKYLTDERIPLRALTMAMISELTVAQATAEDAQDKLAARLLTGLNTAVRQKAGADLIDQVRRAVPSRRAALPGSGAAAPGRSGRAWLPHQIGRAHV